VSVIPADVKRRAEELIEQHAAAACPFVRGAMAFSAAKLLLAGADEDTTVRALVVVAVAAAEHSAHGSTPGACTTAASPVLN